MSRESFYRWGARPAVLIAGFIPLAILLADAFTGGLGANPIEEITHRTGEIGLIFLVLTLSVSPVSKFVRWPYLIRFRRILGLVGFLYLSLHFLTYLVLDQFFDWNAMVEDVAKRPFITVGFASFVLLIPLALTSTKKMIKRLGGRRWRRLHSAVYVAAAGGVIHYHWAVKADTREPLILGLILVGLLGSRLVIRRGVSFRKRVPPKSSQVPIPG